MKRKSILSDEHEKRIREALRAVHDAEQILIKMDNVGIDTRPLKEGLDERRETLEKMLTEFFQ